MTQAFAPQRLRQTVLRMAYAGSSVHVACAFSIIEICAVLYRSHLRFPGNQPNASERDHFVLSKGHGVMAQYACLLEKGWIQEHEIDTYFSDGSRLKGLSDVHVPGCEVTSGSLGHGLPVAVGLALAAKLRSSDQRCFCVVGDGEMNEGSMWEAMLVAAHHKLDNLVVVVDENGFQAMGRTAEVLSLQDLGAKFTAFGFEVTCVDGHDETALDTAFTKASQARNGSPKAVIARTVKGKGVSFMEHDNAWHYTRLSADSYARSLREVGVCGDPA